MQSSQYSVITQQGLWCNLMHKQLWHYVSWFLYLFIPVKDLYNLLHFCAVLFYLWVSFYFFNLVIGWLLGAISLDWQLETVTNASSYDNSIKKLMQCYLYWNVHAKSWEYTQFKWERATDRISFDSQRTTWAQGIFNHTTILFF